MNVSDIHTEVKLHRKSQFPYLLFHKVNFSPDYFECDEHVTK